MSDVIQQPESATRRSQQLVSPLLRIGLLLGVAVHLAGFLIFRVVSSSLPDREEVRPFVGYVSAGSLASDRELEEQAVLFDSAPLFIPTRWNASHMTTYEPEDALQDAFSEFEPAVDLLRELEPSIVLLSQEPQVSDPMDLLASRYWRFFTGITESATSIQPFPDSLPMAQVSIIGQPALEVASLPAEFTYKTSTAVTGPVVYYVRIAGSGVAQSAPNLGQSSGNAEFDAAVIRWLKRPEVIGQLPVGYLSIRVYP